MPDILDELVSYWKRSGNVPAHKKADVQEIEEWECKYNVILPADLRDYVLRVNGALGGENLEFGDDLISFLPLSAMCPEREWIKQPVNSNLFVIADYCISCYWWCAALDNSPHDCTPIFLSHPNRLVANSLANFFDLYMTDNPRLHGGL